MLGIGCQLLLRDQLDLLGQKIQLKKGSPPQLITLTLVLERSSRTPNHPTLSAFFELKHKKQKEEDLGAHAWSGALCRLRQVQVRTRLNLLGSSFS